MRKLFVLVPALTLATTTSVLAQARFQQTVEVKVKPGHERAYESYLKKVIEAADKIKSPLGWNTFFVAVGKQSPTYRVALSFDKWADRDRWPNGPQEMLAKAFGEQEASRIDREGRLGIESVMIRIWERLHDGSSFPGTGDRLAKFYGVTIRHVKPAMVPEFRSLQRKFKGAYEASREKMSVTRFVLRFGEGQDSTFRLTEPFDTWAEIDGWRNSEIIGEHLGEEEIELVGRTMTAAIWKQERFVSAHRPGLSRAAPGSTTNE